MNGRLTDSVAVVTGGARGIGEATCFRLAEDGADVAVVDQHGEEADETAATIEERTDSEAIGIEADVGSEQDIEAMAETVRERFGRIDVLVNNAAIRVEPRPVTEADEESWDRILDVNLKGAAFCAKHLIPLMADRDDAGDAAGESGSIVNVASVGARLARSNWSQYDATKGAIVAMTRDMACDHAPDGIRVNAVSPGWVITDYHLPEDPEEADRFFEENTTPNPDGPGILKRAAEPSEIADAIAFLASEGASFVTAENLHVDGGHAAVGTGLEWNGDD